MRLVMVEDAEELQTWNLCVRVCVASVEAASRDVEAAAEWAQLGQEIAARVRAPEGFRNRLQGYALGHAANVLRVSGKLKEADATLEEAKRLWHSGADPAAVLDPGRLLDLEASLRRDQRRLDEALARLDEAAAVGRCPERVLIKKGITLEKMGEYEQAVETLLRAEPLVERPTRRGARPVRSRGREGLYREAGKVRCPRPFREKAGRARRGDGGAQLGVAWF
jgi:tetratricopeptide (TPR) repeat protein